MLGDGTVLDQVLIHFACIRVTSPQPVKRRQRPVEESNSIAGKMDQTWSSTVPWLIKCFQCVIMIIFTILCVWYCWYRYCTCQRAILHRLLPGSCVLFWKSGNLIRTSWPLWQRIMPQTMWKLRKIWVCNACINIKDVAKFVYEK